MLQKTLVGSRRLCCRPLIRHPSSRQLVARGGAWRPRAAAAAATSPEPHAEEAPDQQQDVTIDSSPRARTHSSNQQQVELEQYKPGQLVEGVVKGVQPYGAFVELPCGIVALLHISQISHERVKAVEEVFAPGDQVTAMVLEVDVRRGRLGLSTKQLERVPGDMLRDPQMVYSTAEEQAKDVVVDSSGPGGNNPKQLSEEDKIQLIEQYERGQLVEGVVKRLMPYGAFVELPCGLVGLLHISQISRERVERVEEVFQPGDSVKAVVMRTDVERGRLTLSTKQLEASPGDMLQDPQMVYSTAEEEAEKSRERRRKKEALPDSLTSPDDLGM